MDCAYNTQVCILEEVCGSQQNDFASFEKRHYNSLHTQWKHKLEPSYCAETVDKETLDLCKEQ